MKEPHIHAELIKEWADGAQIECLNSNKKWVDCPDPFWYENTQYRLKKSLEIASNSTFDIHFRCYTNDFGKIIKVEVL